MNWVRFCADKIGKVFIRTLHICVAFAKMTMVIAVVAQLDRAVPS